MKPISEWLTKAQVAQALRVSERTVDRLHARGRLAKHERGPNVPVYNPDQVLRLAREKGLSVPDGQAALPAPGGQLVPARLFEALAAIPPPGRDALPLAELRAKVYLTTAEAVRYTGLPAAYLGELVARGKLKRLEHMRPYRYRRADLEKL